jgi:hypothetical protein
MSEQDLTTGFASLAPWTQPAKFSDADWENYIRVARQVQNADPKTVESALEAFMQSAFNEQFKGYESESKPFLLMRVVFQLPEAAPEKERRSFKGWENWPPADANGNVNLSWPVSWRTGRPELLDSYQGSMGEPYAAADEYRYLLSRYPYRQPP